MSFQERRSRLLSAMQPASLCILYSGIPEGPKFEPNVNFFYLTGLDEEHMVLLLYKEACGSRTVLFRKTRSAAEAQNRGGGQTDEQIQEISGIDEILECAECEEYVHDLIESKAPKEAYFDCHRFNLEERPGYNFTQARTFAGDYPGVRILDVYPILAKLRMVKDDMETAAFRKALEITGKGLQAVMAHLQPGMTEYQAQAWFEFVIAYEGAQGPAFPTISAGGNRAAVLHYKKNSQACQDGDLLLMDLGAKYKGYCADITRTFPVNGTFSPLQRQLYDLVLAANQEVAAVAAPGMTRRDLNEIAKGILREGCMRLGLIREPEEISRVYTHGVSHLIGLEVHDPQAPGCDRLEPGNIISDEPGLYFPELKLGIRIEDDLLITKKGCIVLSEDIIRSAEAIEEYMQAARKGAVVSVY